MVPRGVLIAESILLGLPVLLALPVWALVPMLFGVTEFTPRAAARRIHLLLLLFPIVASGSMIAAFLGAPGGWLYVALPLVPLAALFAAVPRK